MGVFDGINPILSIEKVKEFYGERAKRMVRKKVSCRTGKICESLLKEHKI